MNKILVPMTTQLITEYYAKGLSDAHEHYLLFFDEFVHPYFALRETLAGVTGHIDALMLAGDKIELLRELLEQPRKTLANILDEIDELNKKSQLRWKHDMLDITMIVAYRDSIVRFRTGETTNGDEIRALGMQLRGFLKEQHKIRETYLNWKMPVTDYIGDELIKLSSTLPSGSTALEQGKALLKKLNSIPDADLEVVQRQALNELKDKDDRTLRDYCRQQKSRRRKQLGKLGVTNALSHPISMLS